MKSRDDTANNGVYVGTDGFACGAGRFKVTNGGKLTATDVDIKGKITATSGKFDGTIYAKNIAWVDDKGNTTYITANNLQNGAVTDGKIAGGAVGGGNIKSGAVSYGKTNTEVKGLLDAGKDASATLKSLMSGSVTSTWVKATNALFTSMSTTGTMTYKNSQVKWGTINGTTCLVKA